MNKANVIALCHKIEQKTGLSFNTILLYYFLESILKRLTDGENKDSFIFKGGLSAFECDWRTNKNNSRY